MRPVLLFAALLSASAALWLWLGSPMGAVRPGNTAVEGRVDGPASVVLVAARDLAPGQVLTDADVAWAEVAGGIAVDGMTRRDQVPDAMTRVAGMTTNVAIASGKPVVWSALSSSSAQTLAARIAPGKFAYSIVVSEATAAGGLILPGDRIDILATQPRTATEGPRTTVIAQDIPVLAVDQAMSAATNAAAAPARTLTLELDAATLTVISTAAVSGGLSAALRATVVP